MEINWINSDEYYHFDLENGLNKEETIKQLILKTLELSSDREAWDVIILDKWIFNLGRLIANIQNASEAVGMDRGYRVALTFNEYAEGLNLVEDDEEKYDYAIESYNSDLEQVISEVLGDEEFRKMLKPFYDKNPFTIEVCEQGERMGMTIEIN